MLLYKYHEKGAFPSFWSAKDTLSQYLSIFLKKKKANEYRNIRFLLLFSMHVSFHFQSFAF